MKNNWLRRFSKDYRQAYVEELKSIKEQFKTSEHKKWSSIEEALEDFAIRNNFSRTDRVFTTLMREAGLEKEAGIAYEGESDDEMSQQLREEGLGSQALEFMGKSKNKHNSKTWSPFDLDNQDVALKANMLEQEKQRHENKESTPQDNEVASLSKADLVQRLMKRFATEFGKILNLEEPSLEKVKELTEELSSIGTEAGPQYTISRYGFRFTGIGGSLRTPGEPIKVTIYSYGYLKDTLAQIINDQLRHQLEQELPINQWIDFLKQESQQIPGSGELINRLKQLHRDLFSEKATYLTTTQGSTDPLPIKLFLRFLPASYQKAVLKMLAEGKYRHWVQSDLGKQTSRRVGTSYKKASFILMQSYDPFVQIVPDFSSKEQMNEFAKEIIAMGKGQITSEEFEAALQKTNINYFAKPTTKENRKLKIQDAVFQIQNKTNPEYKPIANPLSANDLQDPDKFTNQMIEFQDYISGVLLKDLQKIEKARDDGKEPSLTPLAYENTEEGIRPVTIMDLDKVRKPEDFKDFTSQKFKDLSTGETLNTAGLYPHKEFQNLVKSDSILPDVSVSDDLLKMLEEEEKAIGQKKKPVEKSPPSKVEQEDPFKAFFDQAQKKLSEYRSKKIFAANEIWVTDDGQIMNSEEQMLEYFWETFATESKDEIINLAIGKAMAEIAQMPEPKIEDIVEITEEEVESADEIIAPPAQKEESVNVSPGERQLAAHRK